MPPDPAVLADAAAVVALLDQMASTVPVEAPWTAPNAEEWDSQTLATWLSTHGTNNPDFRAVVNGVMNSVFGAEPSDISLLFTLFYIASSGNAQNPGTFERNFSTAGGAQESASSAARSRYRCAWRRSSGSRVLLSQPAQRIQQTGSNVIVTTPSHTMTAQQAIVAMPPTLAGRIQYVPDLPAERDQLTQRAPQGSLMKFDAVYDHAWWRDKGLIGPGRERERADQDHVRRLAGERHARRPARLHRRPRGALLVSSSPPPRCAPRRSTTSPTTSARRRAARATPSS